MTHQLCLAPHRDNPPPALGGLKLCGGHREALEEALTGPSAAQDPMLDCAWGVRVGTWVTAQPNQHAAVAGLRAADGVRRFRIQYGFPVIPPPAELVCGDGTDWITPGRYRPGGIARDWLALEQRGRTIATGTSAGYVSGSAENPLPIDGRLAGLRSDLPALLRGWIAVHREHLGTAEPAGGSIHQLVTWLAVYRDWAAAQEWAGDYVRELTELRGRAKALIDLPRAPRVDVGACPEHGCEGQLRSAIREEHDPRPSLIQCDACGREWDTTQWMRLGQRLIGPGGRMVA